MSRKHKKNRKVPAASNPRAAAAAPLPADPPSLVSASAPQDQASPVLAASVTALNVLSLHKVLCEQTRACIEALDWARLGELAQQPLDQYSREEQERARAQLLYMRMLSILKGQQNPGFSGPDEHERLQVRALIREFEALHREPLHHFVAVFDIYLETVGYDISSRVDAVKRLTVACLEVVDGNWLRELRRYALGLTPEQLCLYAELTEEDKKLVQDLPDMQLVLSEAYAVAASDGDLGDADRLLVQVLKAELDTLMAEPWDYEDVAARILKIPGPSRQGLAYLATSGVRRHVHPLTPRAWAILWTLYKAAPEGRARALSTFFEPDPCAGAEALRLLAQSTLIPQESTQVDALVAQAATLLAVAMEDFSPTGRDWIAAQLPSGPVELYLGWRSLAAPEFAHVLQKLYETLPAGYSRAAELLALYRVVRAQENMDELDEEEPDNTDAMPGLKWLCDRSPRFTLAAASVICGGMARVRLLLAALEKWGTVEGAFPATKLTMSFHASDEKVVVAEAQAIAGALERIGANRTALTNDAVQVLHATLDMALDHLCTVPSLAEQLSDLCRTFNDDLGLTEHGLGLYARVCFMNEACVAGVQTCLTYWAQRKYPQSYVLADAMACVAGLKNAAALHNLTELLQPHKTQPQVAQLMPVVTKRLAEVDKQDQFLRTGVDRWPALKPLTRKLLVVLNKVSRYDSLAELGQYAGIDANWVKWHYDRLVESGMLLVESGSYTINPYVKPLLERESQHAVVGRIVRASGTSAIKQVFNSQREFGIYQVMVQLCPNHLVMPNCSLQSIISYERIKELVDAEDFSYYLKASVDLVVASTTTYLPMLAVEVDSVWHDTDKQTVRDERKDRIFGAAGIPLLRLRPVGDPSPAVIHGEVASHFQELVTSLRQDLPGFEQARSLLEELGKQTSTPVAR